jgi:hypothetical protein
VSPPFDADRYREHDEDRDDRDRETSGTHIRRLPQSAACETCGQGPHARFALHRAECHETNTVVAAALVAGVVWILA